MNALNFKKKKEKKINEREFNIPTECMQIYIDT